jgi:hypothetical protein
VQDYKRGRPPHKNICSKPLRETPLDLCSGSDPSEAAGITLYTPNPNPALSLQLFYLRQSNFSIDYCFNPKDDDPFSMTFTHPFKSRFLEARKNAMEKRDLGSIAVLDLMLSYHDPDKNGKTLNYTPQLEKEYEVDMKECRKEALRTNQTYREFWSCGLRPKSK